MSSDAAWYSPESFVVTVRSALVSALVIFTVAPATTAPFWSVTVPTMSALFVWAIVGMARTARRSTETQPPENRRPTFPFVVILKPRADKDPRRPLVALAHECPLHAG